MDEIRLENLTPAESRVAALVGTSTNREIATQLSLSEKTVEGCLSRIYRKLGVRSRTELALLVADARIEGNPLSRTERENEPNGSLRSIR